MIINFTKNNQFATRLTINDKVLETVEETKLLGSIISSDLTWHRNTDYLVKKGYQRLQILMKLYSFNIPTEDLVHIYILYVRSILEFNACVWHFSITQQERCEIERVQKVALKIILKNRYTSYEKALEHLNLETLESRRLFLCKKFAKKCTKHPIAQDMFPKDNTRHSNEYKVAFAKHDRLLYSAIPQMQRILNQKH